MLRICKGILTSHIKFIKSYIVKEHINAAEVISCNINFLTIETCSNSIFSKNINSFQKQRTRTAGRIYKEVEFNTSALLHLYVGIKGVGRCRRVSE